jgi:uncharacterized membrane protein required for colicin V production
MEMIMDNEAKLKKVLYIILFIVAVVLALHCSEVRLRHIFRLITNYGHSDRLHWARLYFLILIGIGAIIIQNVFIRKAIKRIEENKDNQERIA